jgi:hypothetical protein
VYLITAPKRGNTAAINDAIVAEITDKTLLVSLFNVEIVVEVTKNTLVNALVNDEVLDETTDNIFPRINLVATVAASVTA